MLSNEKKQKLDEFIKNQNKIAEKEGKEIKLGNLNDFKMSGRENYMLTGILGIDLNTNGFKKGTFNVLYGAESGGKSTLALQICEGLQLTDPDKQFLYVDSEGTLDEAFISRIPNLKKENITFLKDGVMENIFDTIKEIVKEGLVDVIIIDSVDSMTTNAQLGKSLEDNIVMDKSRILSRALSDITDFISKYGITIFIIQQERINMSGYTVKQHGRSGGKAMLYYPSTVYRLAKINSQNETEKDQISDNKVVTQYVKIINEKSKISEPFKETFTWINLDRRKKIAVKKIQELVDYAILYGLITKGGSWYEIVDSNGETKKVQGSNGVNKLLSENPDFYTELKMLLYSKGLPPELFIIQFNNIKKLLEEENKSIKKIKIETAKILNKEDLITNIDKNEFKFDEKLEASYYFSEEEYKLAMFNLKNSSSIEETEETEEIKETKKQTKKNKKETNEEAETKKEETENLFE